MDFFREPGYRAFMEYLNADGGFYFERWGDAAVRSLAVALLLEPEEVHYFGDEICYCHSPFCATAVNTLSPLTGHPLEESDRDKSRGNYNEMCVERLREIVTPR